MLRAIWAQTIDGVIGNGQGMPWHLPEDLAFFKATTMNEAVIMGRITWETLPQRPLPGRPNFILSHRAPGVWSEGAQVIVDLPTSGWIIGGGKVYAEVLPLVSKVQVTLIDAHLRPILGTHAVCAPDLGQNFTLVSETEWYTSETGKVQGSTKPVRYKFQTYQQEDS